MSHDTGIGTLQSAVIATTHRRVFSKVALAVPLFTYLLILYVLIELCVGDVRHVMFTLGSYSFAWVDMLYLLAAGIAMFELLKVSAPGTDNTAQALSMLLIGIVYLVCFVLGTVGVNGFTIFSKTEFLYLLIVSGMQVVMAFVLNSRTLKRTIDNTSLS